MIFNSIDFLIFFPIVFLIYYIIPKKIRYIWLLLASYYFYMCWNPWYILLLISCTLITYISALLIERAHQQLQTFFIPSKITLLICTLLLLAVLGYFKYFDFGIAYLNKLLHLLHFEPITKRTNVLLPIGISFYILQSLGYVFDVYRGKIYAEKNFLKYALFVSFFPQLVAGPIERSKNLLTQLAMPSRLSWHSFWKGILLILYGLFCKIVIADRIAIIVKTVYSDASFYPGLFITYAAFLFSFQIYCDFYGYSTIARGSALLLGIKLTDNFNAPYLSKSVKEFWRRWHISLSSWFRDYMYIPLGGNRKGSIREDLNLLFVFVVSGLWHGASMHFVIWGFLNGFYQVTGSLIYRTKNRIQMTFSKKFAIPMLDKKNDNSASIFSKNLLRQALSFVLIMITWIFFAADGLGAAMYLLKQMISVFNWTIFFDGSIYTLGVGKEYTYVLFLCLGLLMLVDYLKYRGQDVAELVLQQSYWFKILCFMGLIILSLLLGCYGEIYDTQQFIYFQF